MAYDQPGNSITETEEDDLYKPTSTGDKEQEKGPKRLNLLELAQEGEEGKRRAAERMVGSPKLPGSVDRSRVGWGIQTDVGRPGRRQSVRHVLPIDLHGA